MLRALPLLSDERLAQLTSRGSDPAFATLYRRYETTLFAYCRSITRNADDGWDAFQNAMVKAMIALKRTERDAPVRPWLFRIAHNEAIALLRRRCVAQKADLGRGDLTSAGADEEAALRESVGEVVGDVRDLPAGPRAALVMRELNDLDYSDIAVALGTSENNARQLVFAARSGLRDSRDGRGLACEQVRHQLSFADGRLLRRRTVRAHLRSCDACREFAASVPRRTPARAWFPLAAALESVLGTGGGGLAAPLFGKAAVAAAVAVSGIGAVDVSTLRPEQPKVAAAKPQAAKKTRKKPTVRRAVQVPVVVRRAPVPVVVKHTTVVVHKSAPRHEQPQREQAPQPKEQPQREAVDFRPTRDEPAGRQEAAAPPPATGSAAECPGTPQPARR